MKYWIIIAVFLVGFTITILGALFKLMHWPVATLLLMLGMGIKVIAVVLLIIKLISNRNKDNILNK